MDEIEPLAHCPNRRVCEESRVFARHDWQDEESHWTVASRVVHQGENGMRWVQLTFARSEDDDLLEPPWLAEYPGTREPHHPPADLLDGRERDP